MKKIFNFSLAMIMAFSMTATAFAAEELNIPKVNIEIDDGKIVNAQYSAYRLLDAVSLGTLDGEEQYSYTVNSKYKDILETLTGKEDAEIIKYIDGLDTDKIRDFADAVYQAIKENSIQADETTSNNKFDEVGQGYYLIAETVLGKVDGNNQPTDSFSLVMLDTVATNNEGKVTITTKEDIPTVDKKVQEVNDSTGDKSWGEDADHDVGDEIAYQIRGTVSEKYADYIAYDYQFVDTMEKSLTLDANSIQVIVGGTVDEKGDYVSGGTDVTTQFNKVVTEIADDPLTADVDEEGTKLTLSADLKKLTDVSINTDTTIFVLYKATLNEKALYGKPGNKNVVYLKYSNDPYVDSNGNPDGTTPPDTTIVFTFHTLVNKVNEKSEPLTGAGFTLYKWNAAKNEWLPAASAVADENGTKFDFRGLDCGKYKLEETKVPSGYNKAEDIIFEVKATYDSLKDPVELTELYVVDEKGNRISGNEKDATFTTVADTGLVDTSVENLPGVVLPSTGGMGTTLFYVVGAVLVIGSLVLIVTRKRMGE